MNLIAKHILIRGRVQGVFFRKNTKQVAEALNITGWVKNTDEGHVEILAQADRSTVEQFITWCRQGPPKAYVEEVKIEDASIDTNIKRFSIEY
jgi:acylphosphatase